MTWIGTRFFNIKTLQYGVGTYFDSMGYTAILEVKFDDHTETISMNNVITTREHEIRTQEKYKHIFWEIKKGNFAPLADPSFVNDPIQLWIQWSALDDEVTSDRLRKEIEFLSKITKEDWLKT